MKQGMANKNPPIDKPTMSIEMMFEDIPNNSFSHNALKGVNKSAQEASKPSKSHPTRAQSKGRNKVVKSGSEPRSGSSSRARKFASSISSTVTQSNGAGILPVSKSAEEARSHRKASRQMSMEIAEKLNPTTALAMFSPKLTPHEREEIKDYENIYYMGLTAKKHGAGYAKCDQTIFDDDENFYKVVPHDHIIYRYEVAEKPNLGKGTFGQVIKAYDHKEKTYVALKLVRNERIYLKQAREELRILQVLRKQDSNGYYNIVLMKEFFMFRNHMVISFELLGMNLYQVISKNGNKGLPLAKILPIARAILKCLELLFKNRIIHCDLKPENIMLRRNGELSSIKVGDFGSSCYEQQQVYHYIQSRYYRAPEVILGMRYGPAIDMWSLGCVLGELFTGSPLLMGNSESDQLAVIEEMVGEIPKSMWSRSTKFKDGVFSKSSKRGAPGTKQLGVAIGGDESFKDLVIKTLTLDPNMRPTPMELQEHLWLSKNRSNQTVRQTGQKQGKKSL